ncbi:hypothetical protein OHC33_006945 [Knufia fluminis]|uniref:2EXR domain-containing protein n=2 Tax=Knufia TaxID=430999 RepID=A0AAN8EI56_9EURO|nr:hypothetical protein OHC33_006945 [Knufia fluminis]
MNAVQAATLGHQKTTQLADMADSMPLIKSHTKGLLDLPSEIRQQIYDHAIPVCRLAPFPYLDSEWSMKTSEHRGVPGLLFTCRKLYEEVAPVFYTRAILEVAPAQQGHMWFNVEHLSTKRVTPYSYTRVVSTFRIYRAEHLKLVRKAHIFSNQADVIDGSCYESLLEWLVECTGIEHIQLSSRPMTRIRGGAGFDLGEWRATFLDDRLNRKDIRTVRIWTQAKRTSWEHEKMMRLRCKATDGILSPMQIYFWSSTEGGGGSLQLDPRWLTRVNDEPEKIQTLEEAAPLIDRLLAGVLEGAQLQAYKDNARYFDGQCWVYQMILVAESA